MPSRRRERSRGFGLVEMIVVIGVVAVLAVIAVPVIVRMDRLERIRETAEILDQTRLALYNTGAGPAAFRQTLGNNAGRLSHLVVPIVFGDDNSCGNNYGAPQRNNWDNANPYSRFNIDPNVGLPTPIGVGNDQLVRTPPGGGGASGLLAIVFPNVDIDDVTLLDGYVDGASATPSTAGLIRWGTVTGGLTTFSYTMTIDNNC